MDSKLHRLIKLQTKKDEYTVVPYRPINWRQLLLEHRMEQNFTLNSIHSKLLGKHFIKADVNPKICDSCQETGDCESLKPKWVQEVTSDVQCNQNGSEAVCRQWSVPAIKSLLLADCTVHSLRLLQIKQKYSFMMKNKHLTRLYRNTPTVWMTTSRYLRVVCTGHELLTARKMKLKSLLETIWSS